MNLQELFDYFFYYLVEKVDYDYRKSIVCLELIEPKNKDRHKISFYGVTSLMWTMEGVEGRICQDFFSELSSMVVSAISLSTKDKWLKSYPMQFNIAIEIMDRALLICANAVEVDGKLHFLKKCNDILDINKE
jgi:hypothetical protein